MPIHTLVDVAAMALLADLLGLVLTLLVGRQTAGGPGLSVPRKRKPRVYFRRTIR
jgi:hypothetical protein